MPVQRVTDISFRGLAHCFNPPGLPLVEKGREQPATTSVLVRGRAGTGKSTLALAVAHAIARASDGMVLVLVTEASLADIEYKASVLGLNGEVVSLEAAAGQPAHSAGRIAVTHLILEHPESADAASAQQIRRDAFETAYDLLERHAALPFRALVVDSLLVPEGRSLPPEPGGRNADLLTRGRLVAFLQSVEDRGISPILIEESGPESSEDLTFPVDMVFGLEFALNADTGRLVRQLVVSKCRYSDSSPGPHDAVLDEGVPTVWPFAPAVAIPQRTPVGFFMPLPGKQGTRVASINRSALILSLYDTNQLRTLRAWTNTPRISEVAVNCGPTIAVVAPNGSTRNIPASHGPSGLWWVLQDTVNGAQANAVRFSRLEFLLAKQRFATAMPELIQRLVQAGLMVVAHGTSSGLQAIDEIADFTGPVGHHVVSDLSTPPPRHLRCAPTWITVLPGIDRPERVLGSADHSRYVAALQEANDKVRTGELTAARDLVQKKMPGANDPPSLRLRVEGAWCLHRIGMTRTALQLVQKATSNDPRALAALGWVLAEMGDYENACRVALDGIDSDTVDEATARLWRALRARFTRTPYLPEPTPLSARLWAEAMAYRGDLTVADALVQEVAATASDSGNKDRLQADLRAATTSADSWRDAMERYEQLLRDEALPALDRADLHFNLGALHDHLGDRDTAVDHLRRAIEANPLHEPAIDRLESFGLPPSVANEPPT